MKSVYYSLFQGSFWHCLECLSTAENIIYSILQNNNKWLNNDQFRIRISNNIRRIIKEKNTNSTEISKSLNLSRSNFNYQIRPDTNTTITSIINIANALEVDFRRFFYDYKINKGIKQDFVWVEPKKEILRMSNNILRIIKEKNITKTQLANDLKMSKSNLGYKISAKNNIRINSLLDVAKCLDTNLIDFFI